MKQEITVPRGGCCSNEKQRKQMALEEKGRQKTKSVQCRQKCTYRTKSSAIQLAACLFETKSISPVWRIAWCEETAICGIGCYRFLWETLQTWPPLREAERLHVQVQCCFTSTAAIRTVRNGEPRTATSTFTQLVTSAETLQVLYEL